MNFLLMNLGLLFSLLVFHLRKTEGKIGTKVTNLLPTVTENCFLEEITMAFEMRHGCLVLCQKKAGCLLACHKGAVCRLYKANVSPHFPDATTSDPELIDFTCFSFWAERKDLAPEASVSSSPVKINDFASQASEGFACRESDTNHLRTESTVGAWFLADLRSSQMVNQVVVQTRGYISPHTHNRFAEIELRIGDNADFTKNPAVDFHPEPFVFGEIVTLKGPKPVKGRYVSLQRLTAGNSNLIIMEMKILSP